MENTAEVLKKYNIRWCDFQTKFHLNTKQQENSHLSSEQSYFYYIKIVSSLASVILPFSATQLMSRKRPFTTLADPTKKKKPKQKQAGIPNAVETIMTMFSSGWFEEVELTPCYGKEREHLSEHSSEQDGRVDALTLRSTEVCTEAAGLLASSPSIQREGKSWELITQVPIYICGLRLWL